MKEKSKNILKGLGVGALACFGMLTFTGCSVDLTKDQIDKLIYTVESSDKFMQDALDLLEKENAKLNAEQAWNLYKLAKTKLFLNDNGVRDNFKATLNDVNSLCFYKTSNGDYVAFNAGGDVLNVTYEEDGKVYEYYKDERGVSKSELGDGEVEQYLYYDLPYCNYVDVKEEDIVSCDILENGNYKITFLNTWSDDPESYAQTNLIEIEISKEAKFIKERILICSQILDDDQNHEYYSFEEEMLVDYEYNVITDEDVSSYLLEAKNAEVTPEE